MYIHPSSVKERNIFKWNVIYIYRNNKLYDWIRANDKINYVSSWQSNENQNIFRMNDDPELCNCSFSLGFKFLINKASLILHSNSVLHLLRIEKSWKLRGHLWQILQDLIWSEIAVFPVASLVCSLALILKCLWVSPM